MIPAALATRFRVDRELGKGGFGAVYLARQLELDREVALKVMLPAALADEEQVRRFAREAKLTALVDHPGVVKLYDHGVEDEVPWIAYEYVPGGNLRQRMLAGPVPLAETLRIAIQLTEGLGAAHTAGLVHRDVKPENVLLAPVSRYKISDFGIARASVGRSWQTKPGMVLGTPWYIAPETLKDQPAPSSDLYAVGILMWELITGAPPCNIDDPLAVMKWHLAPERPRLESAPRAIATVVEKTICTNPDDRYRSSAEMAQALRDARAQLGGGPGPTSGIRAAGAVPRSDTRIAEPSSGQLTIVKASGGIPRPVSRPDATRAMRVGSRAPVAPPPPPRAGIYAVLALLTAALGSIATALWWIRLPPPAPVEALASSRAAAAPERRAAAEFDQLMTVWMKYHDGSFMNPALFLEKAKDLAQMANRMYTGLEPLALRFDGHGEPLDDYELMLLVRRSALAWNWACLNRSYGRDVVLLDPKLAPPVLRRFGKAMLAARLRALDGQPQFVRYVNDLCQSIHDVAKGMCNLSQLPAWLTPVDQELKAILEQLPASPQRSSRVLDPLLVLAWRTGRVYYPEPKVLAEAEAAAAALDRAWGLSTQHRWIEIEKIRLKERTP